MYTVTEQKAITRAMNIIREKMASYDKGDAFNSPALVRDYLNMKLHALEHEVFLCMFLDTQHRLIADEILFTGTIDASSVYPREVVKRALQLNAAAVIFSHNHPSGIPEPSMADERITLRLRDALNLVDIRVLDHIVVGAEKSVSMAERGLL
jgi:DNA repair protein RadC